MSEHMWTFGDIAPEGSEHADIDGFTAVDVRAETLGVSLTQPQIEDAPTLDPDVGDLTVQMDRDEVRTYFESLEGTSTR